MDEQTIEFLTLTCPACSHSEYKPPFEVIAPDFDVQTRNFIDGNTRIERLYLPCLKWRCRCGDSFLLSVCVLCGQRFLAPEAKDLPSGSWWMECDDCNRRRLVSN